MDHSFFRPGKNVKMSIWWFKKGQRFTVIVSAFIWSFFLTIGLMLIDTVAGKYWPLWKIGVMGLGS